MKNVCRDKMTKTVNFSNTSIDPLSLKSILKPSVNASSKTILKSDSQQSSALRKRASQRVAMLSNRIQRILQIAPQILDMFYPDREPHQCIADAQQRALRGRNRRMRHDGRMLDQALDPAQTFRQ